MKLFNDKELKYLPVNCALFPFNEKKEADNEDQPSVKIIESQHHQNKQMEIAGNFYKSVTRMISLKNE